MRIAEGRGLPHGESPKRLVAVHPNLFPSCAPTVSQRKPIMSQLGADPSYANDFSLLHSS